MAKLYCSCQNYSGYLLVDEKEFYFSSTLFRVELPYRNIKRITIDTKQICGASKSVLVIHLQKHQAASVPTTDGGFEKRRRSSKKYFFYGFHDLLAAEETIRHHWEAAKKDVSSATDGESKDSNGHKADTAIDLPFEKASTQNSASRPMPPVSAPPAVMRGDGDSRVSRRKAPAVPTGRAGGSRVSIDSMRQAIFSACWTALKALADVLLSGGPLTFVVVFLLFVLILFEIFHVRTVASQHHAPDRAVTELSAKLALARECMHSMDASVSKETYEQARQAQRRVFEQGDDWVASLERAASALTRQYVYAQVEMAALRQRRLDRVGLKGYFSAHEGRAGHKMRNPLPEFQPQVTSGASSNRYRFLKMNPSESPMDTRTGTINERRRGGFSMQKARDDVRRWLGWVGVAQRTITSLIPGHSLALFSRKTTASSSRRFGPGVPNTRYAESFVPGFDVAQQVSREESEEREACVDLTDRLYRLMSMTLEVFHDFWNTIVARSADEFASGAVKPRHFAHVPSAVSLSGHKQADLAYHVGLSGAQLLKLAFIRRYTNALLFLDPLESNEHQRRKRASDAAESFHRRVGRESFTDTSSLDNTTSVGSRLIEYIGDKGTAVPAHKALGVDVLRNLVEEAALWSQYPEEWTAHRLRTISFAEQQQVIQLIFKHLEKSGRHYVTKTVNVSEASDRYLEHMQRVRPHQLENVPVFRGMLCFSKHPVTQRMESGNATGVNAERRAQHTVSSTTAKRGSVERRDIDVQESEVRMLLQASKERWMQELAVYDIAVGGASRGRRGASRSVHLDNDLRDTNPGLSATRTRLFTILQQFNRDYFPRGSSRGLFAANGRLRRIAWWFWPSNYFRWLAPNRGRTSNPDAEVLRRMGTLDPTVQLVSAQLLEVPWGNQEDAPLLLLETGFIQPSQLLQLRRTCKRKIMQAWLLLCISVLVLTALYFLT